MERGSDRHGPRVDDELAGEDEAIERSAGPAHAEPWRDPEPAGEDQPTTDHTVGGYGGGTPPGLAPDEVEDRTDLARCLPPHLFPADGNAIHAAAAGSNAPDAILDRLGELRASRTYENVQQVWEALGGGRERRP